MKPRFSITALIFVIFISNFTFPAHSQTFRDWLEQRRQQRQAAFNSSQETNSTSNDPIFTLSHNGTVRKYKVHVPINYNSNQTTPVVIYLHGAAGNMQESTKDKMDQEADKLGFILVSPNGTGMWGDKMATWNAGRWPGGECCGWAYKNNVDDVGFISQMIDEIKSKYNVDENRIFVVGISNGGMMTYRLALEIPDKIAAIAAVAPTAIPDITPKRPISVLHIHGTADPVVPFNGGESKFFVGPSAQQMVNFWIKTDECPTQGNTIYQKANASVVSFSPGKNNTEVQFCTLQGAGHAWPSGNQYAPVSKIGPVSYDYSFDQIWEFLQKHSKSV